MMRSIQELDWLSGLDTLNSIPITTPWHAPRDDVFVMNHPNMTIVMHPFMWAQIMATSVEDRFERILAAIGSRVDDLAERACRRVDAACDVDTLER